MGKFNGSCQNCEKVGHKKEQCRDIANNLDSSPINWKGTAESANVATNNQIDHSHGEFMLMKMLKKMF